MDKEDFTYDEDENIFISDSTENIILGNIVLLLTAKAKVINANDVNSENRGDWFLNPNYGNRVYEIKTITKQSINSIKSAVIEALKPIEKYSFVQSVNVSAHVDISNSSKVKVEITIEQIEKENVNYSFFVEVG